MYASPDETLAALERVGYFTDQKTATTVYLAGRLHRPIMLEGPAGAGKTELATSVSRAYKVPILRLQCYQGINEEKAIGQYDKSLQELYVLLMSKSDHTPDWAEIKREVTSRAYFMAGPLLEAIEQNQRCVLLIDEIDKVDYAFEAMLLELLSAWTLSIPKMGTVQATSIPYVFLTSNQERRLGDPLRRRSFYLVVEHPTAEREAAIVAKRTPDASEKTHRFIAGLANPRAYTDRLNEVLTASGWTRQYTVHTISPVTRLKKDKTIQTGKVLVTCTVTIAGIGSHSGSGEEWADDENAMTSAEAQAFKRACSCFGLGRYF